MALDQFTHYLGLQDPTPPSLDFKRNSQDHLRIANALRITPKEVGTMAHRPLKTPASILLSKHVPIQICRTCSAFHHSQTDQKVQVKGWFEYWNFECAKCQRPFSSLVPPRIKIGNPRYEDPVWYDEVLKQARIGAGKLSQFTMHPHRSDVSPAACLELLSMRTGPRPYQTPGVNQLLPRIANPENHCIAEILLPGLSERLNYAPLIPRPWQQARPIKGVVARTILFAALAIFLADPPGAWVKVREQICHLKSREISQWLSRQPVHVAKVLGPTTPKTIINHNVSQLQQL